MMLAHSHYSPRTQQSHLSSLHHIQQQQPQHFYQSQQQHHQFDASRFTTNNNSSSTSQSLSQVPDLMPSTDAAWPQFASQQTPRAAHRFNHHRESSLSSLGSNGPSSPYNATTSNPQIAITGDSSAADAYQDMTTSGDANYSYQLGKPMTTTEHYYTNALGGYSNMNTSHNNAASSGLDIGFGVNAERHDRNLAAASELSVGGGSLSATGRSHPVSVASSIAGGDSPATPPIHELDDDARRRVKNGYNVAKLNRTMTDVFGDELYNPNFAITSMSPPPQTQLAMSPTNELFAQRLQAANNQHLSAVHSPVSSTSRDKSPFRHDSPHFAAMDDFSNGLAQVKLEPVQQQRDLRQAEQERQAQQQLAARSAVHQQSTPNTISPKDAVLEFNDADDGANFPLFTPHDTSAGFDGMKLVNPLAQHQPPAPQQRQSFQPNMTSTVPLSNGFNFSMPTNLQIPQQYPFVARARQQNTPSTFSSRLSSVEGNGSDLSDGSVQRPARTNADGGTYTCTYHGCTQRFETPALLQKHKREGHRQANALSSMRGPTAAATLVGSGNTLLNSQAGPHKCERINPSTGKPCNTIFSRPYDLTRHEDTIHNARKQKVRCDLCSEEKTFSRADALTRHYRVCHPDVEFPGKHRRRGGIAA